MSNNKLHKGSNKKLFLFAKENRKNLTSAEELLWNNLRNRKLANMKFRRQHPIDKFIADFYCHECKLVVEIDGEYHNDVEQQEYDNGRTYELAELDLKVIRFTNQEVLDKMEFVLCEIKKHITGSQS